MTNILVTGGNGQLGNCLKDLSEELSSQYNFIFKSSEELDITDLSSLTSFFELNNLNYCINCAAYTNVDQAEDEIKQANLVNHKGVEYLAQICHANGTTLIHISTDFVFNGNKSLAYNETDLADPQNEYGLSKLLGEKAVKKHCKKHFIIRTSWLYSEYGTNFLITMLKLSKTRKKISVVADQIGSPTYARDLAEVIINHIIKNRSNSYGLYHFSNEGVASWYDFAQAIFDENSSVIELTPITTKDYPTKAVRPSFSVLEKSKIKETFNIEISHWRTSLKKVIQHYLIK